MEEASSHTFETASMEDIEKEILNITQPQFQQQF